MSNSYFFPYYFFVKKLTNWRENGDNIYVLSHQIVQSSSLFSSLFTILELAALIFMFILIQLLQTFYYFSEIDYSFQSLYSNLCYWPRTLTVTKIHTLFDVSKVVSLCCMVYHILSYYRSRFRSDRSKNVEGCWGSLLFTV